MKCYNLDDIRTEINNYLAEAETKLKAWEAVTYPTKKDGKPFAAISRNINGANYHTSQYASRPDENLLTVWGYTARGKYISDDIYCYENVPDLRDDNKKAKTQNHQREYSCWKALYKYDLDDIKAAVSERCKFLYRYCADLRADLLQIDNAYQAYAKAVQAANTALEATLTDNGTRDTYAYNLIKDSVNC